jgi:MFS family permease
LRVNDNKLLRAELVPIVMLSAALALRQMSMTIVMPFISTYCRSLSGYTPLLAGFAVGIFGLMQAIFQIPFGVLSDRYGNKKMLLIGLAQVVAGLVLAYFARSIGLLILARGLQGSGAIIGVAYSWAAGLVGQSKRTEAMSVLGGFISAAAALAFAIGPLLRGIMPVNWMFLSCAILLSLNSLYILFFLRDAESVAPQKALPKGQISALLRNRAFIDMNLAAFLNNFMMMAVFYALPFYLDKVTGERGMWKIFVPAILVAILFMKAAVSFSDKGNNRRVLIAAFLLSSVSLFCYFDRASFSALLAGTSLFMCGYITLATLVATNVNNIVEDSYRGTANGIFNSFQYIGSFAGAVAAGALWGISDRLTWFVVICIGIIGVALVGLGKSQEPARTGKKG